MPLIALLLLLLLVVVLLLLSHEAVSWFGFRFCVRVWFDLVFLVRFMALALRLMGLLVSAAE